MIHGTLRHFLTSIITKLNPSQDLTLQTRLSDGDELI